MRKVFGLCILVILFIALSGCTQPAPSAPATTVVPTTESTPVATTVVPADMNATPMETATANTTGMPENGTVTAEVTPVANVTAVETTAVSTPAPARTPEITTNVIHIRNNTFVPSATTVLPGTGITWMNDDKIIHSVKATGANAGMFTSGDIVPGTSWSNTFGATTGTISYTDPNFPGMNGTIIIQKGRTLTSSY